MLHDGTVAGSRMMNSALEDEGRRLTSLHSLWWPAQGFACSGGSVNECRKYVLWELLTTKIIIHGV